MKSLKHRVVMEDSGEDKKLAHDGVHGVSMIDRASSEEPRVGVCNIIRLVMSKTAVTATCKRKKLYPERPGRRSAAAWGQN